MQSVLSDMAMGWVNPWVGLDGLGWVSKVVGWVRFWKLDPTAMSGFSWSARSSFSLYLKTEWLLTLIFAGVYRVWVIARLRLNVKVIGQCQKSKRGRCDLDWGQFIIDFYAHMMTIIIFSKTADVDDIDSDLDNVAGGTRDSWTWYMVEVVLRGRLQCWKIINDSFALGA